MSGSPVEDAIRRLDQSLGISERESTAETETQAGIARLDRLLQNMEAPVEEQPTPEEVNTAESGPALQNPGVARMGERVRARPPDVEETKAFLEESLNEKSKGGVIGGTVNMEKGIPDRKLQFIMARSRNFQDMREKFEKAFGDKAELVRMTDQRGRERILFRESPDQEWGIAGEDVMAAAGKILTPQTGLAIGTAILTRGRSLGVRVGGQTAAGATGEVADIAAEQGAGYARDIGAGGYARAAAFEGAVGAAGEVAAPVAKGVQTAYGKATDFSLSKLFAKDLPFGEEYVKSAERMGATDETLPAIGQASGDPRIQQLYGQVSGSSPLPGQRLRGQTKFLQQKLEDRAASSNYQSLSGSQLETLSNLEEAEIKDLLLRNINRPQGIQAVDAATADRAVKEGIDTWRQTQRELLAREYAGNTRGISRLRLDASNLKGIAEELPTYARTAEGEVIEIGGPQGQLRQIVTRIGELADTMRATAGGTGPEKSAVDQIVLLRDKLHDLAHTGPLEQREYARKLWEETKSMMANPIGARGPVARARVQRALNKMDDYEEKKGIFSGFIRGQNPEGAADTLFKPGKFETLKAFKEVAPQEFNQATDAFLTKLGNDPENVDKVLDQFTKNNAEGTLRLFMSDQEEAGWRTFAKMHRQWNSSRYKMLAGADSTAEMNAKAMIFGREGSYKTTGEVTVDIGDLDRFMRLSGGKNGAVANDLRAGVYAHILNEAMETSSSAGGRRMLDPTVIRKYVDALKAREHELSSLMRPQDWEALQDFGVYASMIEGTRLAGQLQTAGQVARISQLSHAFTNPQHYALTIANFLNTNQVARIMSNPVSSRMIHQAIQAGSTPQGIRLLNGASAIALEQATRNRTGDREDTE